HPPPPRAPPPPPPPRGPPPPPPPPPGPPPPVAARQNPLQQARLHVVLLDVHRLQPHPLPQPPPGLVEVLARLHRVPLVRRVRLQERRWHPRPHHAGAARHHLLASCESL